MSFANGPPIAPSPVIERVLPIGGCVLGLILFSGCNKTGTSTDSSNSPTAFSTQLPVLPAASSNALQPPTYAYEINNTFPHDPNAFTQGLLFLDGNLFESTGLNGQSSLRKVDLKTGRVLKKIDVASEYFAEGLATLNGKLFQLTWQNHKAFVYDLTTFHVEKEFSYEGEGWGLTTDGQFLIMSDGTQNLRFIDSTNFTVKKTISVYHNDQPVTRLNELEFVKGEIFANIWQTFYVARVDPETGKLRGVINFNGILSPSDYTGNLDVMNGIAYDPQADRLFVTGKNWPKVFEIRLKP